MTKKHGSRGVYGSSFVANKLETFDENSWNLCDPEKDTIYCGPHRLVLEKSIWPVINLKIALREFLLQALIPFTLPYYFSRPSQGRRQLIFTNGVALFLSHLILQPVIWVILIWYLIRSSTLYKDGLGGVELLSPVVFLLAHRACVALKYSFLTDDEYKEFRKSDPSTAHQWLESMQILSSWLNPPVPIIAYEVWLASRQYNLKLSSLFVTIPAKDCPCFHNYLEVTHPELDKITDVKLHEKGDTKVPLLQLVVAAFIHAKKPWLLHCISNWSILISAARVLLFAILRVQEDKYKYSLLGDTPETAVLICVGAFINFFFYRAIMLFFLAGALDASRMLWMVRDVGDFVRISGEKRRDHPRVQLSIVENIRAWVGLRRMVQQIGYRYRKRLVVYTGVGYIVGIAVALEAIGLVVTSPHPADLQLNPEFIQSIFDLVVVLVPTLTTLYINSIVNLRIQTDIESLISHRIAHRFRATERKGAAAALQRSLSVADSEADDSTLDKWLEEVEYDDACDDLLDTAIQALDGLDAAPLTFLGIRADTKALTSVATVLGTLFGFLLGRVYFPTVH
eukprot:c10292_g1_i2.p1 GENE.c10292_g1_i2~~c10292_g1_i2.p1  ORF type:complete len:567 (+),score=111.27 c10292_g1_i2:195-1895(+)